MIRGAFLYGFLYGRPTLGKILGFVVFKNDRYSILDLLKGIAVSRVQVVLCDNASMDGNVVPRTRLLVATGFDMREVDGDLITGNQVAACIVYVTINQPSGSKCGSS